jgi:ribosome maturation factor RimP
MDKRNIETRIDSLLSQHDMELVALKAGKHGPKYILQFYIDRKTGKISLEDCEKMSNVISSILDMENLVAGAYILEVSSPGIDRPLNKLEHFERFKGKHAKIRLKESMGDKNYYSGVILGVKNTKISIDEGNSSVVEIEFDDIEKANLDEVNHL